MTRHRWPAPVLALVLGAALLVPSGPVGAVEPKAPRIDRLTGRVLHTASGDTVRIPVPKRRQNSLELLGEVRGGWLVAHHWDERMLIVAPDGTVVRSFSYARFEDYPGNADLVLDNRGGRVLVAAFDRGDEIQATVLGLRGREVASRHFASEGTVLGSRGTAFHLGLDRLVSWRPGKRPHPMADARVVEVSVQDRLVVRAVGGPDGDYAVAPLRAPDRILWRLPEALHHPDATIAPDGRHVLATAGRRIMVLGARDGTVATSWRLARDTFTVGAGVWEDDGHVLVDVRRGDRHTLMRCGLHDRCERTVPWQAHPLLGWDYSVTP